MAQQPLDIWIDGKPIILQTGVGSLDFWVDGAPLMDADSGGEGLSVVVCEVVPRKIELVPA
jgi:hypothetical protein